MRELPSGWITAPLESLASVQLGRQRSPKNHSGPNMRPYLRAANVTWKGLALDDVKEMHFSPAEVDTFRLRSGDILLAEASGSASEVGKPAIWRDEIRDCCFQNTLLRVRSPSMAPHYLLWFFKWLALSGKFGGGSRGVGIHHLGAAALSEWLIPVAPRVEQDRIVAAIEEQISRLDAGVAAIQRALVNASSLVQAVMEEAVAGWNEVPLRETLTSLRNGTFVSRPGINPTRRPILRISAVRPLRLDASDVRYVPDITTLTNEDAFRIRAGDLLFTRYNGNAGLVGACALVGDDAAEMLYPDKLIRGVVNRNVAMPEYLEIALNCGPTRRAIADRRKTTAGQVGISGSQLLGAPVPLPPLKHQEQIVSQARSVLDGVRRLQAQIATLLDRSEALQSSVLTRAFAGTLVPQDPGDESAFILLELLATERRLRNAAPRARTRVQSATRARVHA